MLNTNRSRLGSVLAVAALSFGSGCVDNNESLFIRQVPLPDVEDQCTVTNDPTGAALSSGLADVALTSAYAQYFLVGNQLIPRGDADLLRPETSRVQLYEAEVDIFDGGVLVDKFTVPVAGFVDPANETEPSFGIAVVNPVITANTLSAISAVHGAAGVFIVARVKVNGTTLGGLDVATGVFDFPIFVCGDRAAGASCVPRKVPASCMDELPSPCLPGQDSAHDCRAVVALMKAQGITPPTGFCTDATGEACL
jgi:hypothetical protein